MKKIIKVLRGVLVSGKEWNAYQDKMLNNLNGGGKSQCKAPKTSKKESSA